jgi:hypothetical protein
VSEQCPFYNASIWRGELVRFPGEPGNRCALITSAHSPCRMQIAGRDPDWKTCPRNPEVNGS